MKIICLLLCTLSLTAARVHPRTGVNDDLNGVEGVMYDIPEYEDPEVNLFKLIARGLMPVYTVRDVIKDSKDLSNKNDTPHYQTDNQTDITKGLDTVIIQLQEAKNKLESGNNAIYFDIDKSVLSLENLKQRIYVDLHNASSVRSLIYNASTERPLIYNASTERPLIYNASTERPLIYNASTERPLIYNASTERPLIYNASTERPLIYNASTERPLIYNASTERPLMDNVSTELLPVNNASTEQPFVWHEAAYAYIPVAEFSSDEEEVKTDKDDVSSADADKVEKGDKTLIRKKWSYKLSSLF